jgi:putative SOS response-associated peptidase YedK
MPTLYRLDADASAIGRHFDARTGEDPWSGGTIVLGSFAPVITAGREFIAGPRPPGRMLESRLIPRLWGVPPPPSASGNMGEEVRREGIGTVRNPDSPFWIGNLRNAEFRCLLPASAFMVWGKGKDAQGRRRRCWFGCSDQPLFAMAGVWKDSEVPSFAVMTCEPNAILRAEGREAMPVILPADPLTWQAWLHAGWDHARKLLVPYSSSLTSALE